MNAEQAASPIASVLGRIETGLADVPGSGDEMRWRGRVADEAALLVALLRGCFDGAAASDPEHSALTTHLRGMMERGVPPRPVQRFLRAAAAAAFAELWQRAGPGDATAVLRASRILDGRCRAAERLLHDDHEFPPAPQTMEAV